MCLAVWDQWRVSYFHETRLIYIYCVSRVHCTKSALALVQVCWCSVFDRAIYTVGRCRVHGILIFMHLLNVCTSYERVYAMHSIAIWFLCVSFLLSPSPHFFVFSISAYSLHPTTTTKRQKKCFNFYLKNNKKIKRFLSDKVHQSQLLSVALESIAF